MCPLVAHCHLALGQLHATGEDRSEAEEHLGFAMKMYRELDMEFWLARAEAVQKESGGAAGSNDRHSP